MAERCIPGGDTSMLTTSATRHFVDITRTTRKIVCTTESAPIAGMIGRSFTPRRNVIRCDEGTTEIIVGDEVDPFEIRQQ